MSRVSARTSSEPTALNLCLSASKRGGGVFVYLLKARTVDTEVQPLLGNSCVTRNVGVTIGSDVFVRPLPGLYNDDQLPVRDSHETAVGREDRREMAASLRGREPGSRGTSAVGSRYQAEQ
jgi:hypothetical protein